jgi:hypothetical protein
VVEAAVHAWEWEPHLGQLQLEERFRLREAEAILTGKPAHAVPDHIAKMLLDFEHVLVQPELEWGPLSLTEYTTLRAGTFKA